MEEEQPFLGREEEEPLVGNSPKGEAQSLPDEETEKGSESMDRYDPSYGRGKLRMRLVLLVALLGAYTFRRFAQERLFERTLTPEPIPAERRDWDAVVAYTRWLGLAQFLRATTVTGITVTLLWSGVSALNGFERIYQAICMPGLSLSRSRLPHIELCFQAVWNPVLCCFGREFRFPDGSFGQWVQFFIGIPYEYLVHAVSGAVYWYLLWVMYSLAHIPFDLWELSLNINYGFIAVHSDDIVKEEFFRLIKQSFIVLDVWLPVSPTVQLQTSCLLFIFIVIILLLLNFKLTPILTLALLVLGIHFVSDTFYERYEFEPAAMRGSAFPHDRAVVMTHFPERNANRILYEGAYRSKKVADYMTIDNRPGIYMLKQSSTDGADATNYSEWCGRGECSSPAYRTHAESVYSKVAAGWKDKDKERPEANVSMARSSPRDFEALNKKLISMAEKAGLDVSRLNLRLVEPNINDTRKTTYAAGTSSNSIIAIFDTLFLGEFAQPGVVDGSPTAPDGRPEHAGTGTLETLQSDAHRILGDEETLTAERWNGHRPSLTDEEVAGLMAREVGHIKLEHWTAESFRRRLYIQTCPGLLAFGLAAMSPLAALMGTAPAVVVATFVHTIFPLINLGVTYVVNGENIAKERAADVFAAELDAASAKGLEDALIKLSSNSNVFPDAPPLYQLLHDTYPSLSDRLATIHQAAHAGRIVVGGRDLAGAWGWNATRRDAADARCSDGGGVPRPSDCDVEATETLDSREGKPSDRPPDGQGTSGLPPGDEPGDSGLSPGDGPGTSGPSPGDGLGNSGLSPGDAPGKSGLSPLGDGLGAANVRYEDARVAANQAQLNTPSDGAEPGENVSPVPLMVSSL